MTLSDQSGSISKKSASQSRNKRGMGKFYRKVHLISDIQGLKSPEKRRVDYKNYIPK